ncbi:MAG TPA: Holliday junction resolvase RuvX [Solirubrobacteraceae bacterium]
MTSGRVLALDYGSARCGCALSDPTGTLATPIEVVERPGTKKGMGRLLGLVRAHAVSRVVVGLPLGLSGRDTDQTREAREFAARLAERLGDRVPVELYDERFTTRVAQRSGGRAADEDSRAAAVLLEDWLAAHAGRE